MVSVYTFSLEQNRSKKLKQGHFTVLKARQFINNNKTIQEAHLTIVEIKNVRQKKKTNEQQLVQNVNFLQNRYCQTPKRLIPNSEQNYRHK